MTLYGVIFAVLSNDIRGILAYHIISQVGYMVAGVGIGTDAAGLTKAYNPGYTYWTDFIFQAMFAATAATIVSGAVAERMRFRAYVIITLLTSGLIYPLFGQRQGETCFSRYRGKT